MVVVLCLIAERVIPRGFDDRILYIMLVVVIVVVVVVIILGFKILGTCISDRLKKIR